MDLLRRHLFVILCGVGCVGGIALGVTGWVGLSRVVRPPPGKEKEGRDRGPAPPFHVLPAPSTPEGDQGLSALRK